MIRSYKGKKTEKFANGIFTKQFESFRRPAEKRLRILESATCLADLAALNSNRLELLSGDRQGQHSIRINGQWRVCFIWSPEDNNSYDVEIVDYH